MIYMTIFSNSVWCPYIMILIHFIVLRFLNLIEEEIYGANSPIWDPEFKHLPPAHLQATLES